MKNQIQFYVIMTCMLASYSLFGQTVTKTSASPVSGTVCPGVSTFYEVSVPTGFGGCKIDWSAVNGQVTRDANDQRKAKVVWADTPGAKGKVTAAFSTCGNSNDGTAPFLEELILSVKGKSFGTYTNFVNIDYCTKAQAYIQVPSMAVDGTGGINQPPRTEVAYAWTVPAGWREVGTNRTGQFGTAENFINIEPIDCANPGIVQVKGVLIGIGLCDAAEPSAPATINLNGPAAYVSVVPQSGYTGASACNTTPVTFYATTNVGCPFTYGWAVPSSWRRLSESGNSITLQPSGTKDDSSPIKATINFSCGSSVESGGFTPVFRDPEIFSPAAICHGGTTVSLLNAPPNGVNWDPGTNMIIDSGQGTPQVVLKAATSTTKGPGTIKASIACSSFTNITVPPRSVWVGRPNMVAQLNNGQLIIV